VAVTVFGAERLLTITALQLVLVLSLGHHAVPARLAVALPGLTMSDVTWVEAALMRMRRVEAVTSFDARVAVFLAGWFEPCIATFHST
jgi:hypothetical protein